MTPRAIAELRSRAPEVKLEVVLEADHHVTLDNPAGFIGAVKDFLAQIA
jgi:pimeloyl-ACP methyl ester carboxylesterase